MNKLLPNKVIPHVESTEIIAQVNLFIEILNSRGHGIRDWDNTDCILDRVEYDRNGDEFYCFFKQEERN